MRDLFDAHVAFQKKACGSLEALVTQHAGNADAYLLLKEVLKIGRTKIDFSCQISNRPRRFGLNDLHDPSQPGVR
jgi:hypothetical protein